MLIHRLIQNTNNDNAVILVAAHSGRQTGNPGHVWRPQPARHAWDPGRPGRHRGRGPWEEGVGPHTSEG